MDVAAETLAGRPHASDDTEARKEARELLGLALAFAPGGLEITQALLGAAVWAVGLWSVGKLATLYIRLTNPARFEEMGVDSALGFGDVKMMGLVGAFTGVWGGALTALRMDDMRRFSVPSRQPKRV